MSSTIDLKEIERKAFTSSYEDGLYDIYLGAVAICLSFLLPHPEGGYSPAILALGFAGIFLSYLSYRAGKKFLTLPRLGGARFSPARARKKRSLSLALGALIVVHAAIVGYTMLAWLLPETASRLLGPLHPAAWTNLLVAALASFIVGTAMTVQAYFSDFTRGYLIAAMMAAAVFLAILLNSPLFPLFIGALILIPGIVLLVRFMKSHPAAREEASHE